jgi:hypothetical protein
MIRLMTCTTSAAEGDRRKTKKQPTPGPQGHTKTMNKKTMIVALIGAFLGMSATAFAGPGPGKYRGKLTRNATGLDPRVGTSIVKANNPGDPTATYSTHVESVNKGTAESLSYTFDVLPDGNVNANIRGKIKIGGKVYQFSVSGQAMGTFTDTSIETVIPMANVSVQKVGSKKVKSGKTNLALFAGSPKEGEIMVHFIAKSSEVLPLRYEAKFKGKLVP